ncbi:uncharacterized protein B0H64DRAFT_390900 [Chaetomium fimeti]|uniref:Uncharacterized protein n=1 Tax=Chaetomium fimeti TaxID=1854472 RepID=A0AAE0HI44_9PEZI|nr:hypothetical protein B0H64DRAFT_390900 [Chaetomium fimeti]
MRAGIRAAIAKLEEYRNLLEDSSAYLFAMILDPSHKTLWMKKNLQSHQVDSCVAALKQCFDDQYSHLEVSSIPEASTEIPED